MNELRQLAHRLELWLKQHRFAVSPLVSGFIFGYPFYELVRLGWFKAARVLARPGTNGVDVVTDVPPYQVLTRSLQVRIGDPEMLRSTISFLEWTFAISTAFLAIYCIKLYLSLTVFDGKREYHDVYVRPLGGFRRVAEVFLRAGAYLGLTVVMLNYDWLMVRLEHINCVPGLEPYLALWIGVGAVATMFLVWDIIIASGAGRQKSSNGYWRGHLVLWIVAAINVATFIIPHLLGRDLVLGIAILVLALMLLMLGTYISVIKGLRTLLADFMSVCVDVDQVSVEPVVAGAPSEKTIGGT